MMVRLWPYDVEWELPMSTVRVDQQGPIWTVILSRPEVRNAVDPATAAALADAFRAFEADDTALAAVLWGEGGHFCAGADLKAVSAGDLHRLEPTGDGPMGPSRMQLSKPVIAAIEGYAVAGGLELACWCDLRVAAEDAALGVLCRRWGVPLIDGGTVRLPRLIGESRAMDLVLTGRLVPASEAHSMGLVNRLVPPGEARAAAEALAAEIAAFPQGCLRADRASVRSQWAQPLSAAIEAEFKGSVNTLFSEGLEGAQRFSGGQAASGRSSAGTASDPSGVGA